MPSYSSYMTQADVVARILRLEVMLGLLIRQTEGGVITQDRRDLLLNFAGVLDAEQNLEQTLEAQQEVR